MYLSSTHAAHLSTVMSLLAQSLGERDLRQQLANAMANLLNADYVASFVWSAPEQRFEEGLCCRGDATLIHSYESHFQFEDPIPGCLHPYRIPMRVSRAMGQSTLVKSDFFNRFLRTEGLYWGINLFAHDGSADVGDFRIWRQRAKDDFDANDIAILRMLYPALVQALARARRRATSPALPATPTGHAPWLVGMSPRERQVCQLAADGLTDKEIAQHIGIGYTTVRTHLTSVLRKSGNRDRKSLIRLSARLARD
ncbi:MAG: helix-turn-helix transcriptional regulator [Caldimonas sp.]